MVYNTRFGSNKKFPLTQVPPIFMHQLRDEGEQGFSPCSHGLNISSVKNKVGVSTPVQMGVSFRVWKLRLVQLKPKWGGVQASSHMGTTFWPAKC